MSMTQQYYCMRIYVTYRCNSQCGYCNVWRDHRFRNHPELSLEDAKDLIRQCFDAGVRYIDFTGGEPSLNRNLAELARYAGTLGIKTEITSNAVTGCTEYLLQLAKSADKFNISLDTIHRQKYKRIRGVDGFPPAMEALDGVLKFRVPKLMTVVTEENEEELDELIRFAQEKRAEIYLNPVFTYFDEENGAVPKDSISRIRSRIFEPYTVVMLHFLEFIQRAGTDCRPPCSANSRTLTFAPNGDLMLPCYHAFRQSIPWRGNLAEMLGSDIFRRYAAESGKANYCKNCAVVPYFGISFNYSLDSSFLIQEYSEKLHHLKRDFLNQIPEVWNADATLTGQLDELLDITRSLKVKKNTEWLYDAEPSENGVLTRVYRSPLTPSQFRREREAGDCWQLTIVPHTGFDLICKAVYRNAYALYKRGERDNDTLEIFADAMEFQLRWWKFYISRYMQVSVQCDIPRERAWIRNYLHSLREWGERHVCSEAVGAAEKLLAEIGGQA